MALKTVLPVFFLMWLSEFKAQDPKASRDYEQAVALFNTGQYRIADSLFTSSIKLEAHPDSYYSRAICRKKLGLDSLYCRDLCSSALLRDKESASLFNKDCGRSDTAYWSAFGSTATKKDYLYYTIHYYFGGSSQYTMAKYSSDNHIIYVLSNDSNVVVSGKADVAAEFKGGNTALYNYVAGHLKVPGWFRKAGRNGIVKVRMLVNKDGRILDTSIKEGLPDCPDCEKEVIRLVQHMPPWKPAESGGRRVNMYFLLPIPFR